MPYEVDEDQRAWFVDSERGTKTMLANFTAKITEEVRYHSGRSTSSVLTIEGKTANATFEPVKIPADKFAALAWIMSEWGVQAIIQPGGSIKEHLRTLIQLRSKPKRVDIYTHTGWANLKSGYHYLHAGGGIGKDGNDPKVRVELPAELKHYRLDHEGGDLRRGIAAMQGITKLADPGLGWTLLGATLAPLLGSVDFAVHISGRTGTYKSEIASICQSFYGKDMDARHLPGSWSSTANALEAQAFRAKDALFAIDDFIPAGTSWQQKAYQKTADQIIRGQGNQAGRARLTDTSNLQETMYPRGLVLSTGEDTPEGHSVRGRMIIAELTPGDIDTRKLTELQKSREDLCKATAEYAKYIAGQMPEVHRTIKARAAEIRDQNLSIGHSRTPSTLGRLLATLEHWAEWAGKAGGLEVPKGEMATSLLNIAGKQELYLTESDPCEAFCEALRHVLASHIGHLRTLGGGIPAGAETLGWTVEDSMSDIPTFKAHGKCFGWIDWEAQELYIDVTAAYADIKRHSNGIITLTRTTMLKRLKDTGLIARADETRSRNTVRITAERQTRTVLAMHAMQTLGITEIPNG